MSLFFPHHFCPVLRYVVGYPPFCPYTNSGKEALRGDEKLNTPSFPPHTVTQRIISSFYPPSSGGSIPPGTRRSCPSPCVSSSLASVADGACRPSVCVLSARCACNNTRSPSTTAAPFGSCVSSGGGDGGCRTCRTSREDRKSSTTSESSSDTVGVSGSVYV